MNNSNNAARPVLTLVQVRNRIAANAQREGKFSFPVTTMSVAMVQAAAR